MPPRHQRRQRLRMGGGGQLGARDGLPLPAQSVAGRPAGRPSCAPSARWPGAHVCVAHGLAARTRPRRHRHHGAAGKRGGRQGGGHQLLSLGHRLVALGLWDQVCMAVAARQCRQALRTSGRWRLASEQPLLCQFCPDILGQLPAWFFHPARNASPAKSLTDDQAKEPC